MVAVFVPPHLETPTPLTAADALDRLTTGQVRVFSSDVFDTLVWRPVAKPNHLFVRIGQRLIEDRKVVDWVTPQIFAEVRRIAEGRARTEVEGFECTLEEIWNQMPEQWWIDGADASLGVATELAVEAEALRPLPSGLELLDAARQAGCRIELISDTYLSATHLRSLLENAGVDLNGVGVHTSCDARVAKANGLLAKVIGESDRATPGAWLHVGDNLLADVLPVEALGGTACWLETRTHNDGLSRYELPWQRLSLATGCDGGREAALHETLLRAGDRATDASYQFGAAVAGPMLAGFSGWVSQTAERYGATRVHCLLREGGRIAELMHLVRPQGPPTQTVHASRWAMLRAAVIDGTADEVYRALGRRGPITAEFIEAAFGVDPADVERALGTRSLPQTRRREASELLIGDEKVKAQIIDAAARLRENALRYLDRTLQPGDGPLVLCDIGWGGSIQEAITEIIRSTGDQTPVIGLYLLLSPPGPERQADGVHIECYLPLVGQTGGAVGAALSTLRSPEFLERISTPAIGTLLGFDDDGEPVCRPDSESQLVPSLERGQRGVIDFCANLGALATGDERLAQFWFSDPAPREAAVVTYANTVELPSAELRTALGAWEHDDLAGDGVEVLTDPAFSRWARYLSANEARTVPMHETYWVNGALSDEVNAQMKLLSEGLDPASIQTESPTGTARLSVFAPGSQLAHAQMQAEPTMNPAGWQMLTFDVALDRPFPTLRSLRFDPAAVPALVELGDCTVALRTVSGTEIIADGPDGFFDRGTWFNGQAVTDRIALSGVDGHFVIDLDPDALGPVSEVYMRIAFRTRPVPEQLAVPTVPAWKKHGKRVARLARRSASAGAAKIRAGAQPS